ncbi:MAG: hypothetical protein LC676_10990 [Loktanella sp.]|nr:hypothetical protein [Loktanella sp.]
MSKSPAYAPTLHDQTRRDLATVTRCFCDLTGLAETICVETLINDSRFIRRISDGANFTVGQYDKLMGSFSALWPEGADWPAGVPRPAPLRLKPEIITLARKRIATATARRERRQQKDKTHGRAA